MILNEKATEAVKKKDKKALVSALKSSGYSEGAASYLAGKLLGEVDDGRTIL